MTGVRGTLVPMCAGLTGFPDLRDALYMRSCGPWTARSRKAQKCTEQKAKTGVRKLRRSDGCISFFVAFNLIAVDAAYLIKN